LSAANVSVKKSLADVVAAAAADLVIADVNDAAGSDGVAAGTEGTAAPARGHHRCI
jgi:hypothetical protein